MTFRKRYSCMMRALRVVDAETAAASRVWNDKTERACVNVQLSLYPVDRFEVFLLRPTLTSDILHFTCV